MRASSPGAEMSISVKCSVGSQLHDHLTQLLPSLKEFEESKNGGGSYWGMVSTALKEEVVPMELLRVLALSDQVDLPALVADSSLVYDHEDRTDLERRDAADAEKRAALNERREYLKRRRQEREYNMMVYGQEINPEIQREMDRGNSLSAKSNHIAIAMNMIMSVLACFAIAYYVGLQSNVELATSMIYGLIAAILILMVEMLLYILRAMAMEKKYDNPDTVDKTIQKRRAPASNAASPLPPSPTRSPTAGRLISKQEMVDALAASAALERRKSKAAKKND